VSVEEKVAKAFAENLLRERKRVGISQEELSFRAGVHRTEVGMVERGVRVVRIDTLIKLAGGLGVEPAVLLGGLFWAPGEPSRGRFEGR
jgi:transcriptional regulator with XRE-family HTH domain